MVITFVANHFCIRAMKQAIALKKLGHTIYGIGFKRPQFFEKLDLYVRCGAVDNLREAIKIIDRHTDIYYVHTEPYWMVWVIREVSKKPILLDMHDSMQWRMPTKFEWRSAEERAAINMVDGLVFPSNSCKQLTPTNKPNTVLYPYVNKEHIIYLPSEWVGGVAYEGRADMLKASKYMNYCKYHDLVKEFQKIQLPFYIYSIWTSNAHIKEYKGAYTVPTQEYANLIKKLTCHDWGIVGNITKTKEWNVAMPNKLFEYLAAGIPIVALNAKECSKFLKKHKVGITVKSLEELKERWDERKELQKRVLKIRNQFTMEKNIKPVEDLCKTLL